MGKLICVLLSLIAIGTAILVIVVLLSDKNTKPEDRSDNERVS